MLLVFEGGQAEIADLCMSVISIYEDVVAFQITVDDWWGTGVQVV